MAGQITPQQLARWRSGAILDFVKTCCVIRRPDNTVGPLLLSGRQRSWLEAVAAQDSDGRPRWRTVGVVSPKRSGKTVMAAAAALYKTITRLDRRSVFLSNSRESAESLSFETAREMIDRGPLGEMAEVHRGILRLPAIGGELRAVPCSAKTVAGWTVTGLLVSDEFWQADDPEPWRLLSSQLSGDGQAMMVSQASGLNSDVYRLYEAHDKGISPRLWFDYVEPAWIRENLSPNPYLTREFLQQRRAELGIEAVYEHYFENVWGEAEAKLIAPALVAAATADFPLPLTQRQTRGILPVSIEACRWGSGIDRAMPGSTLGDDSVYVTVAITPEIAGEPGCVIVVQADVLRTGSEAEVLAAAGKAHQITGRHPPCLLEEYQSKDIAGRLPHASTISPTAQTQARVFTDLARRFNERRILIPCDAEPLIAQLRNFGVSTESALPRFGKKISGGKDDLVFGLAWAVEAAETGGIQVTTADFYQPKVRRGQAHDQATALGFTVSPDRLPWDVV